jgi:hypothetical protein
MKTHSELKLADKLSLLLSLSAFIISLLTFCVQFFYKPNQLIGVADSFGYTDTNTIKLPVTIMNSGLQDDAVEARIIYGKDEMFHDTITDMATVRMTVTPGEVKVFDLISESMPKNVFAVHGWENVTMAHIGIQTETLTSKGTHILHLQHLGEIVPNSDSHMRPQIKDALRTVFNPLKKTANSNL